MIEFSYSNRTAAQGEPWDIRVGDAKFTASKVIFEKVDGITMYHPGAPEGRFGWCILQGELVWDGKIATIKGAQP